MAYLASDDKQNENQGQSGSGGLQSQIPGTSTGGAGFVDSGGISTNATPSGGSGNFTNIQDYLTANKGSTGTADYLKSTVGGAFDKDQSDATTQANQVKSAADSQVNQANVGQDKASQLINQAASNYSNTNSPNQDYTSAIQALQSGLNARYSAPSSYSYGLSSDTQNYGNNLGSDQGFQALLNGLYDKSANGTISEGSKALQQQLDLGNQNVADARQALLSKYAGLQNNLSSLSQGTNAALSSDQSQFNQNQQALKNYLQSEATRRQGRMDYAGYNSIADALGLGSYMAPPSTPQNLEGGLLDQGSKTFGNVSDSATAPPPPAPDNSPYTLALNNLKGKGAI